MPSLTSPGIAATVAAIGMGHCHRHLRESEAWRNVVTLDKASRIPTDLVTFRHRPRRASRGLFVRYITVRGGSAPESMSGAVSSPAVDFR